MKFLNYFVFTCLLFSCDENNKFSYEDAQKSQIQFFFEDNQSLDLYHDLDNGVVEGCFFVRDTALYIANINKSLHEYLWVKTVDKENNKVYMHSENLSTTKCVITFKDKKVCVKIYSLWSDVSLY